MRRLILITLTALVAACGGDSSTAPKQTVAGTWMGVTGLQTLTMTLVENGGVVSGTGTLTNTPTGTRAMTVAGTHTGTSLTATLSSGTLQPVNLQATVSGNGMSGTLTGSGFAGDPIMLTRQ